MQRDSIVWPQAMKGTLAKRSGQAFVPSMATQFTIEVFARQTPSLCTRAHVVGSNASTFWRVCTAQMVAISVQQLDTDAARLVKDIYLYKLYLVLRRCCRFERRVRLRCFQ